jgi:hypothetical protein
MRTKGYAAAWEDFKHTSHMQELQPGDIIFMYANNVGIIAVGKALRGCSRLEPGSPGILWDEYNTREWRVPVDWLTWVDDEHSCPLKDVLPPTFQNVSDAKWSGWRNSVVQHFFGDPGIVRDLGLSTGHNRQVMNRADWGLKVKEIAHGS